MLVLRNNGMGDDPAAAPGFTVGGVDLSSLSTSAATLLSTPITVGANSAPLWAFGSLALVMLWLVTNTAKATKRAATKVSGRAKKIKRGFVN